MKRPDTPPSDEGEGGGHVPSHVSPAGAAAPATPSNSLQGLLRATDRLLLPPTTAMGGGGGGGRVFGNPTAATDLELLLLLQRRRERMAGVNSLLLQQPTTTSALSPTFHHNDNLLPLLAGGFGGNLAGLQQQHNNDAALLRQAETLLAMQRQRLQGSSTAALVGNGHPHLAPSLLQLVEAQDQGSAIPADLSAVLNARLRRMQEQQKQAAAIHAAEAASTTTAPMATKAEPKNEDVKALGMDASSTDKADADNRSAEEGESDSSNGSQDSGDDDEEKEGGEGEGGEAGDGHQIADFPVNDTFPFKLYRMLENAEKQGQESIASFTREGKAFIIHKHDDFVSKIMPHYFTSSRMTSFQRQLNLYGFRRIAEGPDKGAYFHKHFVKGRRKLCKKIKRKKNHPKPPPVFLAPQESLQQGQLMLQGGLGGMPTASAVASSLGLGNSHVPATMSGLLLQPGLVSPALLELRQRQQAQSELVQLLLRQQQEQQRNSYSQDDPNKGPYNRFFGR